MSCAGVRCSTRRTCSHRWNPRSSRSPRATIRRTTRRPSTAICTATSASALPRAALLLRPAVPAVRRAQLRQADQTAGPVAAGRRWSPARASRSATRPRSMLLRAGAELIVTTRFPRDAARRFAREPDFAEWTDAARRLRHRPASHAQRRGVRAHLSRRADGLDCIVNNACQTVRRPPELYRHMMERETAARSAAPRAQRCSARTTACAASSCIQADRDAGPGSLPLRGAVAGARCSPRISSAAPTLFPRAGSMPICSRSTCAKLNSWRLTLAEVRPWSCSRCSSSTRSRRSC